MVFSTRVEYGVLALVDIALYSGKKTVVSALDVAQRQGISKKYLEQILPLLKQAGLIRAQKGLRGGYTLAKPASNITLYDVLNALDNSILEEMEPAGEDGEAGLRIAVNDLLWGQINQYLIEFTKSRTLSEFMRECENRMSEGWDMYVI